jgi:predicted aspartyl protease
MTRYLYSPLGRFPAPFVHVSLRVPRGETSLASRPAQLDTGADRTIIPWQVVQDLGLVPMDEIELGGLDGKTVKLSTFLVELTLRQQIPIILEVAASQGEPWMLLGRDVLNRFRILLDGPQSALEIG